LWVTIKDLLENDVHSLFQEEQQLSGVRIDVGKVIEPSEDMPEAQLRVALKMKELDILKKSKGTKYEFFEQEAIRMPLDDSATGYSHPSQLKRVHAILDSIGSGKTVLDVSGGEGWIARLIKNQGNDVTVTDVSEIRNLRAKFIYKVKHVICRAEKLPFPDQSFDVVILAEILEHLPSMAVGLAEAERVVKRTGRIIITVPHKGWSEGQGWSDDYIHHLKTIRIKDIDGAMLVMTIDNILPHLEAFEKSDLAVVDDIKKP
jgi:2-polyprenyl-3-methyl-5-hydroxy-6-metoxy-1,4-benzoquinol methylase